MSYIALIFNKTNCNSSQLTVWLFNCMCLTICSVAIFWHCTWFNSQCLLETCTFWSVFCLGKIHLFHSGPSIWPSFCERYLFSCTQNTWGDTFSELYTFGYVYTASLCLTRGISNSICSWCCRSRIGIILQLESICIGFQLKTIRTTIGIQCDRPLTSNRCRGYCKTRFRITGISFKSYLVRCEICLI